MKLFAVASIFFVSFLLAGCVGEEYHYVDDAELKPGPGLLSGEDGVFTIYEKKPVGDQEKENSRQEEQHQVLPAVITN